MIIFCLVYFISSAESLFTGLMSFSCFMFIQVQQNADPPVCKIMDFHKEKYKKQMMQKERVKSKVDYFVFLYLSLILIERNQ